MNRLIKALGLLGFMGAIAFASSPVETYYLGQSNLSNSTIVGSTASVSAAVSLTKAVASTTVNGNACKTCVSDFVVQIPTTTVLTILDGSTTDYTLYGVGLAASGVNTYTYKRDHLGPLCITAGNTLTFNLTQTAGVSTNPEVINYEGYTSCGGTNNAGN